MISPKTTNTRNFQKELDKILGQITEPPHLLLHSCCAPCSSYVLEYLRRYFRITVFYYNPNISADEEYKKRVLEQKRLIEAYNKLPDSGYPISVIEGDYEPEVFYAAVKGLEQCPEGGGRCFVCYALRLRKTAELAAQSGQDYFATTLTISPLKNAMKLNEIGEQLAEEYEVSWLPADFKKKNGYKRSIELSAEYDLYRQNYCGCVYSREQRTIGQKE
ncbi:MAG: epoxyqueuosine reductase QueH [Lachnospiraceae bacterium]|nr:epoxyqueuosine reductase QueH [Lachnospiraceae bacterium]